jgi:CRISPR-associated endonuclease Csn1
MKKILGLDLGTNSIGWAVVNKDIDTNGQVILKGIEAAGSRIVPMDASILGDFEVGNSVSQTKNRTKARITRHMRERFLLRRERLHRVLAILGMLPEHYLSQLDRSGKFLDGTEPKLAWKKSQGGGYDFIFKDSFNEMLSEFRVAQPQIFLQKEIKIPYDWTLYYLRKKALSSKISLQELSWILLNFNQKRGYYQLRDDIQDENPDKKTEFFSLKVISVKDTGEKKGEFTWYDLTLDNGWIYHKPSKLRMPWEGKTLDLIVTTAIDKEGKPQLDKLGNAKRSFRSPNEDDWALLKIKTQQIIDSTGYSVGQYIYESLLHNPKQKVIGGLVRTIERKYYVEELSNILKKQIEFHPELRSKDLYDDCIAELYPHNDSHRNILEEQDFVYLFIKDILYYQRPLKSKRSLVDDCPYEYRIYKDPNSQEYIRKPLKCASKSNPLFQEFRLWQFISSLRIYQKVKRCQLSDNSSASSRLMLDVDVTKDFLKNSEEYANLFAWLSERKEVDQKALLKYKPFGLGAKEIDNYRWNYVEDKSYPCNETYALIVTKWKKVGLPESSLTKERENILWQILFSVTSKDEIEKAMHSFIEREIGKISIEGGLSETFDEASFVEAFAKIPPFPSDYAAYSSKAISKLLPLMRMGRYWREEEIDESTHLRINKLISGEYDDSIKKRVRDKAIDLDDITKFQGLPVWLSCYIVYNRHSEVKDITKWKSPEDINIYLTKFKQHSLNNPIVEQILTETLRTVRDIWRHYPDIDEIHVEMGRDMKKTNAERVKISKRNIDNENTNLRIKMILTEFLNPEFNIDNVRPYSPSQQDIFHIYEESVLDSCADQKNAKLPVVDDDKSELSVSEILHKFQDGDIKKRPTRSQVLRYKLWLDQKYQSPYTGAFIPLSRLFTEEYQIEHIIPQARYFDDSFNNKVICEAEVNDMKSDMIGYEFIKKHHGEKVSLSQGKVINIFEVDEYEDFVKTHYVNNYQKKRNLLLDDIPDEFVSRQMNDSRYISKLIVGLMSNIVREEGEDEAISRHIVSCNGAVTDRLKKDWGVNDVWNSIILPRFNRLNEMNILDSSDVPYKFTSESNGHLIPSMPLPLLIAQKKFTKKRIDHRHHAMDAIVIACTTRNHVNLLNNESANSDNKEMRYALQHKLRRYEDAMVHGYQRSVPREFIKPWPTFTQDMQNILKGIIVSFKQNLRVINKTNNIYYRGFDDKGKRIIARQGYDKDGGKLPNMKDHWSIRKSMHKDTVFGQVNIQPMPLSVALKKCGSIVNKCLRDKLIELSNNKFNQKQIREYFDVNKEAWPGVDLSNIDCYVQKNDSTRQNYATRVALDGTFDKQMISRVTDGGIQKILLNHLKLNKDDPKLAFSPEGIEEMNANIVSLNEGKFHQPVLKVRHYEQANKFAVGEKGNKSMKYVEGDKGTNLFFAIYQGNDGNRTFYTIPLNVVIDRLKQNLPPAPNDTEGRGPIFVLSPNDLVYLPTADEIENNIIGEPLDIERIYKMVSCTNSTCFFIKSSVASYIVDKVEFSKLNKMERAVTGEMIKDICVPIKVNRLGSVYEINGVKL